MTGTGCSDVSASRLFDGSAGLRLDRDALTTVVPARVYLPGGQHVRVGGSQTLGGFADLGRHGGRVTSSGQVRRSGWPFAVVDSLATCRPVAWSAPVFSLSINQ